MSVCDVKLLLDDNIHFLFMTIREQNRKQTIKKVGNRNVLCNNCRCFLFCIESDPIKQIRLANHITAIRVSKTIRRHKTPRLKTKRGERCKSEFGSFHC